MNKVELNLEYEKARVEHRV